MMKKLLMPVLGAAIMMGAAASATAANIDIVSAMPACNTGFFKALATDKKIADKYKVRQGDMAFFKVHNQPLDTVMFDSPVTIGGLKVVGYAVNDDVIRYFGVPDMHTHFLALIVKGDWMDVVNKLKLDWEKVDTNHKMATFNTQARQNGESTWKKYQRPDNQDMPDFGMTQKAFNVSRFNQDGMSMLVCSMQSAGAPDEAILKETRPDLLK